MFDGRLLHPQRVAPVDFARVGRAPWRVGWLRVRAWRRMGFDGAALLASSAIAQHREWASRAALRANLF